MPTSTKKKKRKKKKVTRMLIPTVLVTRNVKMKPAPTRVIRMVTTIRTLRKRRKNMIMTRNVKMKPAPTRVIRMVTTIRTLRKRRKNMIMVVMIMMIRTRIRKKSLMIMVIRTIMVTARRKKRKSLPGRSVPWKVELPTPRLPPLVETGTWNPLSAPLTKTRWKSKLNVGRW
jgi:hypothetical protein